MANETIIKNSPVGQHLENVGKNKPASYLVFNKKKVELVAKIRINQYITRVIFPIVILSSLLSLTYFPAGIFTPFTKVPFVLSSSLIKYASFIFWMSAC